MRTLILSVCALSIFTATSARADIFDEIRLLSESARTHATNALANLRQVAPTVAQATAAARASTAAARASATSAAVRAATTRILSNAVADTLVAGEAAGVSLLEAGATAGTVVLSLGAAATSVVLCFMPKELLESFDGSAPQASMITPLLDKQLPEDTNPMPVTDTPANAERAV